MGLAFRNYDRLEKKDIRLNQDYVLPVWEGQIGKTTIRFAHSSRVSEKRVRIFTSKEPTTLLWIDGFDKSDVMVDVGANVGSYAVWAAVRKGCNVLAFEPESLNYADLNKNIHINKVQDKVRAFCVGISNKSELTDLYLSRFVPSFSHHDVGEARWEGPVTNLAESAESRHRQGCVSVRLDWMLEQLTDRMDHLKIDVDGLEYKVLEGASGCLNRFRTILIECDFTLKKTEDIMQMMQHMGWGYSYHQVCLNREGWVTPEEWENDRAAGKGGSNVIFFKDPSYDEWWKETTKPYRGVK